MAQKIDQLGNLSSIRETKLNTGEASPIASRRSIIARTAIAALVIQGALASQACGGAEFTIGPVADDDSGTDAGPADAQTDSVVPGDAADAETDAHDSADSNDAALTCSSTGTVVFDSAMGCYKEGLFRGSNFVAPPESSSNDKTCQSGTCANSPISGDLDVLWVQETKNNGMFTTVPNPLSFQARCSSHTSANPPTMDDLKTELALSGWFGANASNVASSYILSAPSCGGNAVTYRIKF